MSVTTQSAAGAIDRAEPVVELKGMWIGLAVLNRCISSCAFMSRFTAGGPGSILSARVPNLLDEHFVDRNSA